MLQQLAAALALALGVPAEAISLSLAPAGGGRRRLLVPAGAESWPHDRTVGETASRRRRLLSVLYSVQIDPSLAGDVAVHGAASLATLVTQSTSNVSSRLNLSVTQPSAAVVTTQYSNVTRNVTLQLAAPCPAGSWW